MRVHIRNVTVSLQGETVLNHIDFLIKGREKIALVGKNGAGKTTLLRLMAGELSPDRDDKSTDSGIFTDGNVTVGMLRQSAGWKPGETVEDYMTGLCPAEDPYAEERFFFEQEFDRIFTGFGFAKEEKTKPLRAFSGGEQTKIAMIRLLLTRPDILLLDEPTNHLDEAAAQWLEDWLISYEKAAVIVSHDRFFLDRTAEIVYELEDGKLTRYAGNYTAYRTQREKNRRQRIKEYTAQQQEIERLNALIERFKHKPKKASMARSKKKALSRMKKLNKPPAESVHLFTEPLVPERLGSKGVLDAQKLCIGYDKPLHEITLRIRRGQKIGIIGANGTGKTTFIRTITGQIPPLSGRVRLGDGVEIGYFDQHTADIVSEKRVAQYFHEKQPMLTEKEVKTVLAAYLFRGQDTGRKITELSGGEKSRLVLAELMERRPNFLVLDEPTNHMDIPAKETLESAFSAYTGTMLFISHDRYFIKEIADALLIFDQDRVSYYPFGYEHYLNHLRKKEVFGRSGAEVSDAENTVLLRGMGDVPKRTGMQSAGFSTEQSYADWQFHLSGQRLFKARKEMEDLLSGGAGKLARLQPDKEEPVDAGRLEETEDSVGAEKIWQRDWVCWERRAASCEALFTEACLDWYEKWQAYEDAFLTYRE